ncbi:MAG: DCC1-like thiol-disulfide oxidoreductase family protein [Microbacteriaceae bacterium]
MGSNVREATEFILIFDGDCAFCTSSIGIMGRLFDNNPEYLPFQFAELETFGLTVEDCEKRIWLIDRKRQYAGHRALARLLQLQPQFAWRFLGFFMVLPLINIVSFGIYAFVARFRHLLPGGTPACQMPRATKSPNKARAL